MQVDVGRVLGRGRFEVLSRLGEGAAGLVFAVRDRQTDAHLALKTVRLEQPSALALLKREFRAVQDVAHPNLVRLDELFEENGAWFFTMELVDGQDWLSYVRPRGAEGSFDETRLRASLSQIIEALSALHGTGTVHRNVKPSNVLVSRAGEVKLIDFGIAAGANRAQPEEEGIVGTAAFMAPEQVLTEQPTPAWDLYSVGAMLYLAISGRLPFSDRAGSVLEAKVQGTPTPVQELVPGAPADLAALCDALLRSDPLERPDAAAALATLGARQTSSGTLRAAAPVEAFVGRGHELDVLSRAFSDAQNGGTVSVIVEGISGVGKSALLQRFVRDLDGKALVLHGKCNEREYVPYNGVDAIVDGLATDLASRDEQWFDCVQSRSVHLLPTLFPVLRRVPFFDRGSVAPPSTAGGSPQELRARVFAAFREVIARVAEHKPLVLAIDDIQWADGDSRLLLAELLAPPSPPGVLLVCSRRARGSETESAPLTLPGGVRHLSLDTLASHDISDLLAQIPDARGLEGETLRALAAESGGHPLFLQELVRLSARGDAVTSGALRLDEALFARISSLGDRERSVAYAVAVAGVQTSFEVVADAASVPRRDLTPLIATLRAANVVKISGAAGHRKIEPYHDRVREAVVSRLADLPAWHERLARALERAPERDVERLAVHWDGAGDPLRAGPLYLEAAERASAALAFDRAADFYGRCVRLGPSATPDPKAVEHSLATALLNAGRAEEAAKVLLSLAERAEPDDAVDLRSRAANAFLTSGHFAEGSAQLTAVLTAVGFRLPASRLGVIFMMIWQRLLLRLRGLGFAPREPSSIDPRTLRRLDVCWAVAHGFGMTNAAVGSAFHTLGSRLSLDSGDAYRAARALSGFTLTASMAGRKGERYTAQVLAKVTELNGPIGHPYVEAFRMAGEGFAAYMLENWTPATRAFQDSVRAFGERCVGTTYELGTVRNMLGRALAHRGRLVELEALMAPTLRDAVRRNDRFNVINVRMTSSVLLALASGDVARAEEEVTEAKGLLSPGFQLQHVYWLVSATMVALYGGRPDAALALLDEHQAALDRSLLETIQSVRVMTTHLRARIRLSLARRDPARRDQHLKVAQHCATRLRREGLPAAASFATLVEAGLSAARGDNESAAERLRDAVARFDAADMKLYAAAARMRLASLVSAAEAGALRGAASARFAEERVRAVEPFVALHAPGFDEASASSPRAPRSSN
ncbi:MAG TPA: AAA family ATPase [Polyangiaceae bacterium]